MKTVRPWHALLFAFCIVAFIAIFYRDHQVSEGHKAFERLGCPTCHGAGGAPSLQHVGSKYDRRTLVRFLSNPEAIYAARNNQPLNPGFLPMPRLPASHRDIELISHFLSAER